MGNEIHGLYYLVFTDPKADLLIDGDKVPRGKDFRYGFRHNLDESDLIVWLKLEGTKLIEISLSANIL